jgi:hypothetical protein
MTLPHAAHTSGRDGEPPFPQLVRDPHLPEGRLLNGQRNDGILDLLGTRFFSEASSEESYDRTVASVRSPPLANPQRRTGRRTGHYPICSSKPFASLRSVVSSPSLNQP